MSTTLRQFSLLVFSVLHVLFLRGSAFMSAAETFQARLTDLPAELNDRHKYLAHEFAPYLEPQISSYIEFYGADERRLFTVTLPHLLGNL